MEQIKREHPIPTPFSEMTSLVPFFFLFLLQYASSAQDVCDSMSCGGIDIQFPFGLKGANEGRRCSYPNFQLSCDNQSRAILTLPYSGDFVVRSINYQDQTLEVNDPNHCLPKRFQHNLTFSGSPFDLDHTVYYLFNLTFLRCQSNITDSFPVPPISCLSDPSNSSSVIVTWSRLITGPLSEWCDVISSAFVPIPNVAMWPFWPDLTQDIGLTWTEPSCGGCVARGQDCGFLGDKGLQVGCFSSPHKQGPGVSTSAKYGLTFGVGIPGILCLIGLSCFMCGKLRMYAQRRRQPSIELPTSIVLQPGPYLMGLDGSTIEKYPKTVLGESGRLPKPNDNTCPICLSEYQPKETLRSIPECNHYFLADCIDEWLKMNASCPLCRNSPEPSSTVTPSSSLSSSSSLSTEN